MTFKEFLETCPKAKISALESSGYPGVFSNLASPKIQAKISSKKGSFAEVTFSQ